MQERRILNCLIDQSKIPSSATLVTPDNYTTISGNVIYVPLNQFTFCFTGSGSWVNSLSHPFLVDNEDYNDELKIDLGLPSGIKWCSENLGIYNDTVNGQSVVTNDLFKFGFGLNSSIYINGASNSYYSGKESTLLLSNDPAHCILGGKWRTPTQADFQELMTNTQMSLQGDYRTFSGNGNNIQIPKILYKKSDGTNGSICTYMTSTRGSDYQGKPRLIVYYFEGNSVTSNGDRDSYYSIRPVWDPNL